MLMMTMLEDGWQLIDKLLKPGIGFMNEHSGQIDFVISGRYIVHVMLCLSKLYRFSESKICSGGTRASYILTNFLKYHTKYLRPFVHANSICTKVSFNRKCFLVTILNDF